MARVAFITDIHGNLPALEVFLDTISHHHVDILFIGGDVVGIGPFPSECVGLIADFKEMPVKIVKGNHELQILSSLSEQEKNSIPKSEAKHFEWVLKCLTPNQIEFIRGWPLNHCDQIGQESVLLIHYLIGHTYPFVSPLKDPEKLKTSLSEFQASTIFCGHDHKGFIWHDAGHILNPGSFGCQPSSNAPFIIAEFTDNGVDYKKYSVNYEDDALIDAFEARKVPDRHNIYKFFYGSRFT